MNQPAVIPNPDALKNEIIMPNFFSLRAERYFFHEIIPNLDLETMPINGEFQFEIIKDPFSSEEQLAVFRELMEGSSVKFRRLHKHDFEYASFPIFSLSSETVSFNSQPEYYKFTLNICCVPYLRKLKDHGYCSIDWQVMESFQQKYSKNFYRFFTIAHLLGVTEFAGSWDNIQSYFGISEYRYQKWKKHESNFLENIRQEITQHPTHSILFDYSTHESFDKNLEEDRKLRFLYFRITG